MTFFHSNNCDARIRFSQLSIILQTFDSEGRSCSSGASSAKSRDSEKSRDVARLKSAEDGEDDGILVVHDAEDDLGLSL